MGELTVLAIDPGSEKMGVAVVRVGTSRESEEVLYWKQISCGSGILPKRMVRLTAELGPIIGRALAAGATLLAIERPPPVWHTDGGRERRQDTMYSLGISAGVAVGLWTARSIHPWVEVPVDLWRGAYKSRDGWGLNGKEGWKRGAQRLCELLWKLQSVPEDAAEAVLLGIFAGRNQLAGGLYSSSVPSGNSLKQKAFAWK